MSSFEILRVKGIPIRIHLTFLLVLPLLASSFARDLVALAQMENVPIAQLEALRWPWGLAMALALFASVLLHELGHALYAQAKGVPVHAITLLMIGGVTQLEPAPHQPRHEAVMALVGPVVSLALGTISFAVLALLTPDAFLVRVALFYLAGLNVMLGLFNLLPAFPMDGGRILRAVLAHRVGFLRATRVAGAFGRGFALAFGVLGLVTMNVLLVLVAAFVYIGAVAEVRMVAGTLDDGVLTDEGAGTDERHPSPAEADLVVPLPEDRRWWRRTWSPSERRP